MVCVTKEERFCWKKEQQTKERWLGEKILSRKNRTALERPLTCSPRPHRRNKWQRWSLARSSNIERSPQRLTVVKNVRFNNSSIL